MQEGHWQKNDSDILAWKIRKLCITTENQERNPGKKRAT